MAQSPQHPLQIMENQTCYDLNATIENWRQELASQSNLTMEVRRELETHLRDTVAELRQRGLNEEESFWLARKRVGQPMQLAEEFTKTNPATVWRERLFWIAIAFLAADLWRMIFSRPGINLIQLISMSTAAVLFVSSRLKPWRVVWNLVFKTRLRFLLAFLVVNLVVLLVGYASGFSSDQCIWFSPLTLLLIGIIASFLPPQNRKTPKLA